VKRSTFLFKRSRVKKSSLTLLEVVISLALASFILYFIFNTHVRVSTLNVKLEKAKERVLMTKYVQQRLLQVFDAVIPSKFDKKNEPSTFYTETHHESDGIAIVLFHDAGIDPDPQFCGLLKAEIFLRRNKELCLVTTSAARDLREEILLGGVSQVTFQFFDQEGNSFSSWDKENKELPTIVELTLLLEKESTQFDFFLPAADKGIIYKKKGQ
jgi:type II secretory pathway component PulJ